MVRDKDQARVGACLSAALRVAMTSPEHCHRFGPQLATSIGPRLRSGGQLTQPGVEVQGGERKQGNAVSQTRNYPEEDLARKTVLLLASMAKFSAGANIRGPLVRRSCCMVFFDGALNVGRIGRAGRSSRRRRHTEKTADPLNLHLRVVNPKLLAIRPRSSSKSSAATVHKAIFSEGVNNPLANGVIVAEGPRRQFAGVQGCQLDRQEPIAQLWIVEPLIVRSRRRAGHSLLSSSHR